MNYLNRYLHIFACCMASVCALSACPKDGAESPQNLATSTHENLTSVDREFFTIDVAFGYGDCADFNDCREMLTIWHDGMFRIVYNQGQTELSFKLEPAEFERVKDALFSPKLLSRLENPAPCNSELPLWGGTIRLQREFNQLANVAGLQADCFFAEKTKVPEDDAIHLAFLEFLKLKEKYLHCPPWQEIPEPGSVDLQTFKLPMSWPCYMCRGRCQTDPTAT